MTVLDMAATELLRTRYEAALMPNYGSPQVALVRGDGCLVWDADGNCYLDLIGGIAVCSLGHAHPAIVSAVSEQVARLSHISNLFIHDGQVRLAERLLGLIGADGRVFFANSGTEANEAAIKLVRRRQGAGRPVFVAAEGGFHGRTLGSLALTGKSSIRGPFGPFGVEARFVPFGDPDALAAAVGPDCAAVFLEPCLGEGGVVPAPAGYLRAARAACDAAGALLVLDEIQSGIGRTGEWFAFQREGVLPDVLTLAKGLGGGLPIGACVGIGPCGTVLGKGDHGSTFGGNPVACAAALAVLDVIERDGLLAHVKNVGASLLAGLEAIEHPLLAGVRGHGLWQALVLSSPAASTAGGSGPSGSGVPPDGTVPPLANTAGGSGGSRPMANTAEAVARHAGFLVNAVQPNAIRLAPPLVLSAGEADSFVRALPAILTRAAELAGQEA